MRAILNLSNGVYSPLTLKTTNSAHAILYNREGESMHILDPNIGLLACQREHAFNLVSKVISSYSPPAGRTDHNLEASRFDIAPQSDQLPWKRVFVEGIG